jgi:hypothetical protein
LGRKLGSDPESAAKAVVVHSSECTAAVGVRHGVGGTWHDIGRADVEVVELIRAALRLSCLGLHGNTNCHDQEEQCSLRAERDKGLEGSHDDITLTLITNFSQTQTVLVCCTTLHAVLNLCGSYVHL